LAHRDQEDAALKVDAVPMVRRQVKDVVVKGDVAVAPAMMARPVIGVHADHAANVAAQEVMVLKDLDRKVAGLMIVGQVVPMVRRRPRILSGSSTASTKITTARSAKTSLKI
jgi:hypothetical protein